MTEREIFIAALHLTEAAQRRALLDRACEADPGLRGRVEALLAEHDRLGSFLEGPAVAGLRDGADTGGAPGVAAGAFRDYEIVREAGRGGMGVVYEARQLSLGGRRVALKVLPFASAVEPRLLQRFRIEAQAAALLNHAHIVPVYGVGSERGVHYYAMQFIEGQTLADLIRDLRQIARGPASDPATAAEFTLASAFLGGFAPVAADVDGPGVSTVTMRTDGIGPAGSGLPPTPTGRAIGVSTHARAFSRTVAQFGIQAAEALEHAHERGVIHRDIKPSNLMIDARGTLWITDFGLARLQDEVELTQSGDLLGTLRYMSPEQALGRRKVIDHRTDIYSLGVTLYELLTLEPAIRGGDRHEILRRLVEEEPRPVRHLNPGVPIDLATIIGKAMAKDSGVRYGSARELADDLRRFLGHRPIAARPPTLPDRAAKWARRRPALAALVLVSFVASLTLAWAITGWTFYSRLQRAMQRVERAQRGEAVARRRERELQYFLHIALAQAAWRDGELPRVLQLLDACPPEDRRWEWDYIKRLCHADLMTLWAHTSGVLDVAVSPGGTRLASAGNDGTIRVWDAATGAGVKTLAGHTRGVASVAFSPDGARLLSASGDGTVRVWDARTGVELRRFEGHTGGVQDAAFHPDGIRAASGGADRTVRVWDTRTGLEIQAPRHQGVMIWRVAFSPDGARLASAGNGGSLIVWDATMDDKVLSLPGHSGMVRGVAFSPDGTRLASAGRDRTIRVWDASSGRQEFTLDGHTNGVNDVAFSPDGTRLASAGGDGAVRIWDLRADSAPARREPLTLRGHLSSALGVAFITRDGSRVISAGDDSLKVWDAGSAPESVALTGGRAVAISPDGKSLVSADMGGVMRVWDFVAGRVSRTIDVVANDGQAQPLTALAFSPDGGWLATAGWGDNAVRVWDAATWRLALTLRGHAKGLACVAFDPARHRIASGSGDRTLKVWDLRTGQEVYALGGYADEVASLAYSPDGRLLAVGSQHRPVTLHDAATGAPRVVLAGSGNETMCVAFAADGKSFAAGGWGQVVKVWDPTTGELRKSLHGHTEGVLGLAFSPDGSRLASAGADQLIKVWDPVAGREILSLRGHTNQVHDVAFSQDGTRLASAGGDGAVRIWDGRPLPSRAPLVAPR